MLPPLPVLLRALVGLELGSLGGDSGQLLDRAGVLDADLVAELPDALEALERVLVADGEAVEPPVAACWSAMTAAAVSMASVTRLLRSRLRATA